MRQTLIKACQIIVRAVTLFRSVLFQFFLYLPLIEDLQIFSSYTKKILVLFLMMRWQPTAIITILCMHTVAYLPVSNLQNPRHMSPEPKLFAIQPMTYVPNVSVWTSAVLA